MRRHAMTQQHGHALVDGCGGLALPRVHASERCRGLEWPRALTAAGPDGRGRTQIQLESPSMFECRGEQKGGHVLIRKGDLGEIIEICMFEEFIAIIQLRM